MARVNIDILGISELKWTGMGEFKLDDHYIYYYGQESLRRNGVAIMVNRRVRNAVLDAISKTTEWSLFIFKANHSIWRANWKQIWKTQQWSQDWKRSVFTPIPKKGYVKERLNYCTIALISHASKGMLKILQARIQQYKNCELPDVQNGFRKVRGTKDQIANICWITEKVRDF